MTAWLWEMFLNFVLSFFGTIAFSVLFNVERKYYLWCGLTGASGFLVYCLTIPYVSTPLASFFATLVVVLASRLLAVYQKCPITVFLISGIFPVVPGSNVYYTAYYFVTDDLSLANKYGVDSVKIAFAIVLGIILIFSIPKQYFLPKHQQQINIKPRVGIRRKPPLVK